ncbi:hypothetical protein TNCV_3573031 [Trichonephila clavipes]|nr:hypothetical protein TNCV_3573031 [Trichonephila clavipes]
MRCRRNEKFSKSNDVGLSEEYNYEDFKAIKNNFRAQDRENCPLCVAQLRYARAFGDGRNFEPMSSDENDT